MFMSIFFWVCHVNNARINVLLMSITTIYSWITAWIGVIQFISAMPPQEAGFKLSYGDTILPSPYLSNTLQSEETFGVDLFLLSVGQILAATFFRLHFYFLNLQFTAHCSLFAFVFCLLCYDTLIWGQRWKHKKMFNNHVKITWKQLLGPVRRL